MRKTAIPNKADGPIRKQVYTTLAMATGGLLTSIGKYRAISNRRWPSLVQRLMICEWNCANSNFILIFKIHTKHESILKIIWSTCSMTWTAYEPLILCLSCDKWYCGTYQNCWKEWNALIRQRCCRKSRYCQSTDTERHMWDNINFSIFAEWQTQKLWSCLNFLKDFWPLTNTRDYL